MENPSSHSFPGNVSKTYIGIHVSKVHVPRNDKGQQQFIVFCFTQNIFKYCKGDIGHLVNLREKYMGSIYITDASLQHFFFNICSFICVCMPVCTHAHMPQHKCKAYRVKHIGNGSFLLTIGPWGSN